MSSPTSLVLQQLLISKGKGTDPSSGLDWPVFIMTMPDPLRTKRKMLVVYDAAAKPDGRLSTGEVIEHPGFQIRVVSPDYLAGNNKATDVSDLLDGVDKEFLVIDSKAITLHSVSRGPTLFLGKDPETGLYLFTIGGTLTRTEV